MPRVANGNVVWRPYAAHAGHRRAHQRQLRARARCGTAIFSIAKRRRAGSTASRTWPRRAPSASTSKQGEALVVLRAGDGIGVDAEALAARVRGLESARRALVRPARPRRRGLHRAPRPRPHDHRRLSLVHRLGPRHVHRDARAVHRARPARHRRRRSSTRWAGTVSEGMLPNRFPDHGEAPEFNAVDASLWYVDRRARVPCRGAAGRSCAQRACVGAVDRRSSTATPRGTRYGIRMDERRAPRLRRAGRAADLDGRQGRRPRGDAADRQAGRGAGALDQRAALRGRAPRRGRGSRADGVPRALLEPAAGCLLRRRRRRSRAGPCRCQPSGRTRSSRSAGCRSPSLEGDRAPRDGGHGRARAADAAGPALARARRSRLPPALRGRVRAARHAPTTRARSGRG